MLDLADGVAAAADLRRELLLGEAGLEPAALQVDEVHHGPMLAAGAKCTSAWGHVRVKLVGLPGNVPIPRGATRPIAAGRVGPPAGAVVHPTTLSAMGHLAALHVLDALHNREDVSQVVDGHITQSGARLEVGGT